MDFSSHNTYTLGMNILVINSSSYTQRMLQYFLSHYSPFVQTYELDSQIPLSELTPSPDLIFINYEIVQKEKYEPILKQTEHLAPVIMIHDDSLLDDEPIRNYCANFIKRPINPEDLQTAVNQVIPNTKDLKVTPYLEFTKPSDDPSLDPALGELETKDPLPIFGALDDDLHDLLTDNKDITQIKDSTNLFKQFSSQEEENSDSIPEESISLSPLDDDPLEEKADEKKTQIDINVSSATNVSSIDSKKEEASIPLAGVDEKKSDKTVNIIVTPPSSDGITPIKKDSIENKDTTDDQKSSVNVIVTPPSSDGITPIKKDSIENKDTTDDQKRSVNVIVTPPSSTVEKAPETKKTHIPSADSTHHITFTQQNTEPPSQEEIDHIIDQKIQNKWDRFIDKKVKTTLHDITIQKTENQKPENKPPNDKEILNFIDQKIDKRWNELIENKIKKELDEMINSAITKIFKEQLKEILTQKGVQSIREISLDIIPEISRQIVKKEIQKLIQQSSQSKT